MTRRPTYREAVEWIARNDNDGERGHMDLEVVCAYLTVGFVADLFGREQDTVAQDVIDCRAEIHPSPMKHVPDTEGWDR